MIESKSPTRRRALNGSCPRHSAAGFTLIEILVAMLVLAIGLLGVAAMQMRGLQFSHDAYLRSQISVLAYDMADRMRLNSAAAADYATPGAWTVPTSAPTGCSMTTVSAANDLSCWQLQVFDALPPGSTADVVAETGGEYTIALAWSDREGNARSIEYTFQP